MGIQKSAASGALHAASMMLIFGPAFNPNEDNDTRTNEGLADMASDMNLVGNGVDEYAPVYRRGGFLSLIGHNRGRAFGRNLYIPKTSEDHLRYGTLYETWHYYQMIDSGWANLLGNSLFHGNYWVPGNSE
ncbi:MAG: hypothetical protein HND52_19765 [Ignavibacteriae bacterium]|nr:hypothetical protein [Ignavibacteriota bacterium]NOH00206.1 hypothetical protein [Ignavibacteriota bacterium]